MAPLRITKLAGVGPIVHTQTEVHVHGVNNILTPSTKIRTITTINVGNNQDVLPLPWERLNWQMNPGHPILECSWLLETTCQRWFQV